MVTTPNLNIEHMTATQANKEVTANTAFDAFDAALTESQTVLIDDSNAHTLSTSDMQSNVLLILEDDPTPPTAAITLTIPALKRGIFAIRNNTIQTVNASISGQSDPAVVILAGALVHIDSDGVNVNAPTTSSGSGVGGTDGWENVEFINVTNVLTIDIAIPANIVALRLVGSVIPLSNGTSFEMRFSIDAGTSFKSGVSDYAWVDPSVRAGGTQTIRGDAADTSIQLMNAVGNDTGEKGTFDIIIIDPRNASEFTYIVHNNSRLDSVPNFEAGYGGGVFFTADDTDFLRLFFITGNITGKIMVQKLPDTV